MNPHKRIEIGALVVVARVFNPKYDFLVGAVGEVVQAITGWEAMVTGSDWVVNLPALTGVHCPCCGHAHNPAHFGFAEGELRLLDDPDEGRATDTDVSKDKTWHLVTS